jgi:hypothetical protein
VYDAGNVFGHCVGQSILVSDIPLDNSKLGLSVRELAAYIVQFVWVENEIEDGEVVV